MAHFSVQSGLIIELITHTEMVGAEKTLQMTVIVVQGYLFTVRNRDRLSVCGYDLAGIKLEFSFAKRGAIQKDTHQAVITGDPRDGFTLNILVPNTIYSTQWVGDGRGECFVASRRIEPPNFKTSLWTCIRRATAYPNIVVG